MYYMYDLIPFGLKCVYRSVLFKLFLYSENAFSFLKYSLFFFLKEKHSLLNLTQIRLSRLKFAYKSLRLFRILQDVQLEILLVSSREMAPEYPISGVSELHGGRLLPLSFHLTHARCPFSSRPGDGRLGGLEKGEGRLGCV